MVRVDENRLTLMLICELRHSFGWLTIVSIRVSIVCSRGVRRRVLSDLSVVRWRAIPTLAVVLRVARVSRVVGWISRRATSSGGKINICSNWNSSDDSLVVLVTAARRVIILSLWRIAHWSSIVAVRLTIAVVGISALLWHAAVVAAVLVLVHAILRWMILIWAAVTGILRSWHKRLRDRGMTRLTAAHCCTSFDGAAGEASMRFGSVVACFCCQRNRRGPGRIVPVSLLVDLGILRAWSGWIQCWSRLASGWRAGECQIAGVEVLLVLGSCRVRDYQNYRESWRIRGLSAQSFLASCSSERCWSASVLSVMAAGQAQVVWAHWLPLGRCYCSVWLEWWVSPQVLARAVLLELALSSRFDFDSGNTHSSLRETSLVPKGNARDPILCSCLGSCPCEVDLKWQIRRQWDDEQGVEIVIVTSWWSSSAAKSSSHASTIHGPSKAARTHHHASSTKMMEQL